jgi:cytochrome b561
VLYGSLQLPPIAPHNATLFAVLRETHTVLALLLFATFLAHLAAALTHALIFRDDVFPSMAFGIAREAGAAGSGPQAHAGAAAASAEH